MKTIVELLKSENVWVVAGPVRLAWSQKNGDWEVWERKPGSFREAQIIVTQDEAEAVQAFKSAAWFQSEEE